MSLSTYICQAQDDKDYDFVYIPMTEIHDDNTGISQNNNNAADGTNASHETRDQQAREGITRKLDEDAEGALVMTAIEDSLKKPMTVLIRLANPQVHDGLLEAQVPLRFVFFLVGPEYSNVDYHEVGRAMSTLFSDDVSMRRNKCSSCERL